MRRPSPRLLRWGGISALAAALALLALLRSIPYFVEKAALKASIEKGLRESFGVHFRIEELTVEPTLFQGLQANLNTTRITDAEMEPLGDIRHITVSIPYWPLLMERVPVIAKIHLDNVRIPIARTSLFKEIKIHFKEPEKKGFIRPAELRNTEILLSDAEVMDTILPAAVHDRLPPARRFHVRIREVSIRHLKSDEPISVLGDGAMLYSMRDTIPPTLTLPREGGGDLALSPEKRDLALFSGKNLSPPPSRGRARVGGTSQAMGNYKVFVEIPQSVTEKGHRFTAADIARMEIKLEDSYPGLGLAMNINYRHPSDQPTGVGSIRSGRVNLARAQTLLIQLSDTFGFPLPDALTQLYAAGTAELSDGFLISFANLEKPTVSLSDGLARLTGVRLTLPKKTRPTAMADKFPPGPLLDGLNGSVNIRNARLYLQNLRLNLGGVPLVLEGMYDTRSEAVDVIVSTANVQLVRLRQTLAQLGVPLDVLRGRDLRGLLDMTARIGGTPKNPTYRGVLTLRRGEFRDDALGLQVGGVDARFSFAGAGIERPGLRYGGIIDLRDGRVSQSSGGRSGQGRSAGTLTVGSIRGRVQLVGAVPPGGKPAIPEATGVVRVAGGRYRVPDSDVRVRDVRGALYLERTRVRLADVRGRLNETPFRLDGVISTDLSRYDVGLTANNVNIPRFRRDVLAKLPQARELLRQVQPQAGVADAHVRILSGPGGMRDPRVHGRVRLQALALRTGFLDDLIRIPSTTLNIVNNRVAVPETVVRYGPLTLRAEGAFQPPGQYRFTVDSRDIPVDILHDRSIMRLAARQLGNVPSIWNTAGSVDLNAVATHRRTQVTVDFHDAGLSWKGGLFPIHNLNGRAFYQTPAGGAGDPVIATRGLSVQYGNSPVSLQLANDKQLRFAADGVLSPLLLNRTLADPQSRVEPYKAVPFQASANGELALPPSGGKARGNNLTAGLFADLSRNLQPEGLVTAPIPFNRSATTPSPLEGEGWGGGYAPALAQTTPHPSPPPPPFGDPQPYGSCVAYGCRQGGRGQVSERSSVLRQGQINSEEAVVLPAVSDENPYLSARVHLLNDDLNLQNGVLHLGDAGDVRADGVIRNVFNPDASAFDLHLFTPKPLELDRLDYKTEAVEDFIREMKGVLGMDVRIVQGQAGPAEPSDTGRPGRISAQPQNGISGWLSAERVAIPPLGLDELTGRVDFAGQGAMATLDRFVIPGLNAGLAATANNVFEAPVTLDTLNIRGSEFNLERLNAYNRDTLQPVILAGIARALPGNRERASAAPKTLPIRFYDAPVRFDEAVLQNVITKNLSGNLSLYENGFLAMSGLKMEAAGGNASGQLFMNPWQRNFITLDLDVQEVSANALTQALLGVSGEVYGNMAGQLHFTTFGDTDVDLLNNANGGVSMSILEGRLPAIAQVETLLVAANIVRGGVLGLNLNNLMRALQFYDRNYFAELSGDLDIVNGVMYTGNTQVEGQDLDLYIRGGIRLNDGAVNLIVTGVMQQDVSGIFGPIGKLSPNTLIRVLPALGTWGGGTSGIISYIPGVGYIPGLGGRVGDVSRFEVRIAGKLEDPNAIRGFHWVGAPPPGSGE